MIFLFFWISILVNRLINDLEASECNFLRLDTGFIEG